MYFKSKSALLEVTKELTVLIVWKDSMCKSSLLGGAHEGLQHLGPYGNIPNIVAELTGDNVPKDFSEDQGYPDPPNPCPIGKTGNAAVAFAPLSSLYVFQAIWHMISSGCFLLFSTVGAELLSD